MATKAKTQPPSPTRIADNKKAAFNYFFEERFEAGMVLEGWEVKALREGKVQLTDGYVVIRDGELFVIGCRSTRCCTASSHVNPDSARTKKLLMHKDEIRRLIGKVEQKGYTLVPLNLHWKNGKVKCEIALAKGKAEHDKRDTIKDREGKREVEARDERPQPLRVWIPGSGTALRRLSLLPAHQLVRDQRADHQRATGQHGLARHFVGADPGQQDPEDHLEQGQQRDFRRLQHARAQHRQGARDGQLHQAQQRQQPDVVGRSTQRHGQGQRDERGNGSAHQDGRNQVDVAALGSGALRGRPVDGACQRHAHRHERAGNLARPRPARRTCRRCRAGDRDGRPGAQRNSCGR